MGGNKSKPFVDTASRVASKFKAPEIQQVASVAPTVVAAEAVSKKPIGIPPIGIRAPDFEVVSDYQATARIETVKNQSFPEATQQDDREMEMDPAILAEISKWQAVKASPKEQFAQAKHERTASAIRHEEDVKLEARGIDGLRVTKVEGRLDEGQISEFYMKLRDDPTTFTAEVLAAEYKLSFALATQLIRIARMPRFEVDPDGDARHAI